MYTTKLTQLERKVLGQNLINVLTMQNLQKVLPQLEQYIDQKIYLAKGDKAKKFVVGLLEVDYDPKTGAMFRSYLHSHYGNIYLKQDVCLADKEYEGGGYGVTYYKQEVCVGAVDTNGVLKSVISLENCVGNNNLNKHYKVDVVKQVIAEIEALKEQINLLTREVSLFI